MPTYTNYTCDRSKMGKLFGEQLLPFASVPTYFFERNAQRWMDHWFGILVAFLAEWISFNSHVRFSNGIHQYICIVENSEAFPSPNIVSIFLCHMSQGQLCGCTNTLQEWSPTHEVCSTDCRTWRISKIDLCRWTRGFAMLLLGMEK